MSERVFYFRNGDLWYRDWNYGHDALARMRMERQAMFFESNANALGDELAHECRQALAEFDQFYPRRPAEERTAA